MIILDRSVDVVSPIAHDFFYQPLVFDLLDIKDEGVISYMHKFKDKEGKEQEAQKKANLSQVEDPIWKKYRYQYIADVLEGIPNELTKFVDSNNAARLKSKNLSGKIVLYNYKI